MNPTTKSSGGTDGGPASGGSENGKPPLRVLVVEDMKYTAEHFCQLLESPGSPWATDHVRRFAAESAANGRAAKEKLASAADRLQPYEVVVLDLGLPADEYTGEDDPQVGIDVLEYAVARKESCAAVIIISDHTDLRWVRAALVRGADDYVAKGGADEELYHRISAVHNLGQERMTRKWHEVLQRHRVQRQMKLACARVADRMARVVSEHTAATLERVAELSEQLNDRYPFRPDRDPADPVGGAVAALERAVIETARSTAVARCQWDAAPQDVEAVDLTATLERVVRACVFGLGCYQVRWVPAAPAVAVVVPTFRQDVEFILYELVVNAVEAHADAGTAARELSTGAAPSDDWGVRIRVADRTPPIPQAVCDAVNRGDDENCPAHPRAFGLLLAWRVAHGIGGRLAVTTSDNGNEVTLILPVIGRD